VPCHGAAGRGDGPAAPALDPAPADFTNTARWDCSTDGTKFWILQNGIKGTGMAKMGLTDEQAWDVLAYIRSSFASGNVAGNPQGCCGSGHCPRFGNQAAGARPQVCADGTAPVFAAAKCCVLRESGPDHRGAGIAFQPGPAKTNDIAPLSASELLRNPLE